MDNTSFLLRRLSLCPSLALIYVPDVKFSVWALFLLLNPKITRGKTRGEKGKPEAHICIRSCHRTAHWMFVCLVGHKSNVNMLKTKAVKTSGINPLSLGRRNTGSWGRGATKKMGIGKSGKEGHTELRQWPLGDSEGRWACYLNDSRWHGGTSLPFAFPVRQQQTRCYSFLVH